MFFIAFPSEWEETHMSASPQCQLTMGWKKKKEKKRLGFYAMGFWCNEGVTGEKTKEIENEYSLLELMREDDKEWAKAVTFDESVNPQKHCWFFQAFFFLGKEIWVKCDFGMRRKQVKILTILTYSRLQRLIMTSI